MCCICVRLHQEPGAEPLMLDRFDARWMLDLPDLKKGTGSSLPAKLAAEVCNDAVFLFAPEQITGYLHAWPLAGSPGPSGRKARSFSGLVLLRLHAEVTSRASVTCRLLRHPLPNPQSQA